MNIDPSKIVSIDRFERKWDIRNDIDTNTFFIAIYRSDFMFTELYSARNVNTIYFDDKNFSSSKYKYKF